MSDTEMRRSMTVRSMADDSRRAGAGSRTATVSSPEVRQELAIEEPPLYHVILLNDDFTTMEFVVKAIQLVFHRSLSDATKIMLEVHRNGRGIAGTYIRDIARTKAERVMHLAFKENFPLKCILERV